MSARVRILPPVSRKGLYVASAALGLMQGMLGSWIVGETMTWLQRSASMSGYGFVHVVLVALGLFCLPVLLIALLFARVHQNVLRLALIGLCFAPAAAVGIAVVVIAYHPGMLLTPWKPGLDGVAAFGLLVVFGVYSCVGAALILGLFGGAFLAERIFGRRSIDQNGLLCWHCGYNLGSTSIIICPECGRAFDPTAPPRIWEVSLVRGVSGIGRPLLLLACIPAAGLLIYTILTHTLPCVRFLQACPPAARLEMVQPSVYFARGPGSGSTLARPLDVGWWIPDPDSSVNGVSVQFLPDARESEPTLIVARGCRVQLVTGTPFSAFFVRPGTKNIHVRLSKSRARDVIMNRRVPVAMLEAIRREADSAGWQEGTAWAPTTGEKQIDPAPFFP